MIILLDVDGVIADFLTPFIALGNKISGLSLQESDIKDWEVADIFPEQYRKQIVQEAKAQGFCSNILPYPRAIEAVKSLKILGDIYVVTSPWHSQTWVYERSEWLNKYFDFDRRKIIYTSSKYLVRGDILIDDKVDTVEKWIELNPSSIGFIWESPYSRGYKSKDSRIRYTNSWSFVIETLTVCKRFGIY